IGIEKTDDVAVGERHTTPKPVAFAMPACLGGEAQRRPVSSDLQDNFGGRIVPIRGDDDLVCVVLGVQEVAHASEGASDRRGFVVRRQDRAQEGQPRGWDVRQGAQRLMYRVFHASVKWAASNSDRSSRGMLKSAPAELTDTLRASGCPRPYLR